MSEWYCPLPFKHAFVDSTGISACCQSIRHQTTLNEWPTYPELKKLQQQFLNGEIPHQCRLCVDQEKTLGRSLRTEANRDYNNQVFTNSEITFVDYRSSNICNFKCRTCQPVYSNGISQEAKNHTSLLEFYSPTEGKTVSVTEANSGWIMENLSKIERLMFTGGEPTIIPEVKVILKKIVDEGLDHIKILITSNASFTDDFWYKLTETYNNLHWTLSIDAVGTAAEIIRHGTRWPVVEKNLAWMAKHSNSLDVNTVVSELNVFQLKPLLKLIRQTQLNSRAPNGKQGDLGLRHQFAVTDTAINWPVEQQKLLISYFESCLELDLDFEQQDMLRGLLSQLKNYKFNEKNWNRTHKLNTALDEIRSEQHQKLFQPAYT